jgi:ABC-2 type transport system ATP-binding protein
MTCDSVIIITKGRVVASGPLRELARQAGEKSMLMAEFEGVIDPAPLHAVSGISRVEHLKIPDGTRLRITADDGAALAPRLCNLAAEHGWKMRELRPQRQTLEELFVRIVEPESAEVSTTK